MFDRLYLPPNRTEYVTREVHEHRAPTDASVKLLREMEAEAKEQVVEAIRVGNTTFECVVHVMKNPLEDSLELRAIFSLNGKKLTAEHTSRGQLGSVDRRKMFEGLRAAIADTISREVLVSALGGLRDR